MTGDAGTGKGGGAGAGANAEFEAYVANIPPEHRPLFDRLHALAVETHPDAAIGISYGMPGYRVGRRRLNLGVWRHGISVYGWRRDNDGGFVERHPELLHSKSTLRISPRAAEDIGDDEFRALLGGALED